MSSGDDSSHDHGNDGTVDRILKRTGRPSTAAIFIHAGAGYHSQANEKIHLEACSEAARIGIQFLRNGAPATEAVEAAVRSLEDKEITNAGYGSNLNMDGVVECDATVVDHYGRSGACGAVPGIKNPVSLAKVILDTSSKPLSLRRVPPNFLVGSGAHAFAQEHHMATVPDEYLISRGAKDRYLRWAADLRKADERADPTKLSCKYPDDPAGVFDYDKAAHLTHPEGFRDHTSAILTGTWNEGQPDSPYGSGTPTTALSTANASPQSGSPRLTPTKNRPQDRSPLNFFQPRVSRAKALNGPGDDVTNVGPTPSLPHDGTMNARESYFDMAEGQSSLGRDDDLDSALETRATQSSCDDDAMEVDSVDAGGHTLDDLDPPDTVNDTVGAIAIDTCGHIAAASSSGGIGMKHRGRVGPAALVGIGTAVIPEDPNDPDLVSVAAVTSGTGEHMATTMAAGKCAERLYHNTRRDALGQDVEEWDDAAIMESFIANDFMSHPGVRNQSSTGALGVMAVKKTRTGIYLYFAHNTDSFALASMSSRDSQPLCVMSRLGDRRETTQGARKIPVD